MRDYLLDLVGHTHDLGCIDLIKITGTDQVTEIEGLAQDKSVILKAEFAAPIAEFTGVFGMPNLDKLKILLNIAEYRENADITVIQQDRDGVMTPSGLSFKNRAGDFCNDYRFMTASVLAEVLKSVKFKGATWTLEFEPTIAGIQRLKMQAQANSDIPVFKVRTDKGNLYFGFGDHSTHAGEFVFQPGVTASLKHTWSWPVKQVIAILDLVGDKVMRITDEGAMQITVASGIAVYNYFVPAQSK